MTEKFNYTNNYAKALNQFIGAMEIAQQTLRQRVSYCDKQQQKILHYIESKELSDTECVLTIAAIKKLRKERRDTKIELEQVTEVLRKCNGKMDTEILQTYDFENDYTKYLKNILEES